MKAAICVGHSRSGDSGAESAGGVSEWNYNVPVGELVAAELRSHGIEVLLLTDYKGSGYGAAMDWVASELDRFGADCALELHFNAANKTAQGFEYLYWHSSTNGKKLAQALLDAHALTFNSFNRGIKGKNSGDRGALFLSKPACPSVICEPFFGDNPDEWARYSSEDAQKALAGVYADAVLSFLGVDSEPSTPVPDPEPQIDIEGALARIERAETELADAKRLLRGG